MPAPVHPKRTRRRVARAVLVSFVVIALLLGDALTTDADVTSNPESKQAAALIRRELPARADSERDRGRALRSLHGRRARVPGEGADAHRARRGARRRRGSAELLRLGRPVARLGGSPRDDGAARDAKRRGRPARRAGEVGERAGRLPGLDHRHADGRRRLREALRGGPAEGRAADRAAGGADRARCSCSGRSWQASFRCCSGCCRSWSRLP